MDRKAALFAAGISLVLGMGSAATGLALGWVGMLLWAFVACLYYARGGGQ